MLLRPSLAQVHITPLLDIDYLVPKEQFEWVILCYKHHFCHIIALFFTLNLRQIGLFEAENHTKMLLRPSLAQVHIEPLLVID